jgi:hypothetical protein
MFYSLYSDVDLRPRNIASNRKFQEIIDDFQTEQILNEGLLYNKISDIKYNVVDHYCYGKKDKIIISIPYFRECSAMVVHRSIMDSFTNFSLP